MGIGQKIGEMGAQVCLYHPPMLLGLQGEALPL